MHLHSKLVGLPDKLDAEPSNYLSMPPEIQGIPPNIKVLGADATPRANTLKLLFLQLFCLIFTASKA
jgi:hypothetical protein